MEKLNQTILDDFVFYLKNVKYKNKIQELILEHCSDEIGDYIYLIRIAVKKSQQKKGYGSAIISDIVQLANKYNVRIKLWISDIFGVNLNVLYEFYKKNGFFLIKNKIDGYMIYIPKKL